MQTRPTVFFSFVFKNLSKVQCPISFVMQKIKEKTKPTKSSLVHKDISVRLFFISFLFTTFWKQIRIGRWTPSASCSTCELQTSLDSRPEDRHNTQKVDVRHFITQREKEKRKNQKNQTKDRPKHRRKTQSYINSLNFLTEEMTSMSEGKARKF